MADAYDLMFRCIASRLPHAPATSNNVRNITYIHIDLWRFDDHLYLRNLMKTATIDWDTFLRTIRQSPHLQQIAIQCESRDINGSREMLVEFLAQLGGAWFGLDDLLGLYYRTWRQSEWIQLRFDTVVMDEIKQMV